MTVKQGAKTAMPRLRFPGFRQAGGWTAAKLGELFTDRQETGATDLPLLSLMDKEGIVPQEETNRKDNSNADKSKYLRVVPGDIAYNTMRMWEGRSAYVDMEGLISPAYTVCAPNEGTYSRFFSYYFKTEWLISQFRKYSQGLVKDTLNLKFDNFKRVEVAYPSNVQEQQKIAACLASLDEVITAQGRKVEALKAHKRGLMQQLFPREGETRPRLRFPEFRNAPEWSESRLGQLVELQSGATPSKANPEFWNGKIPWVSAKDMKQLFLEDSEDHISSAAIESGAKTVPSGSLLILTRGMTLLKDVPICVVRRDMALNQDVKALRPKDGVESMFLAFLLMASKERLLAMVDIAGHGTGKLDTDGLRDFGLAIPKPEEQQRIADCLSSLDTRITAETNQLSALKTHKQGLMQQLFPAPEATGA